MRILGVCGGNGVILHPMKNRLIGNIEIRKIFHTKANEQWISNFGDIPYIKTKNGINQFNNVDAIIGAPDCGHSSILSYSRIKKLTDPMDNESLNLYFESIEKFKPKIFMMENLPKLIEQIKILDFLPDYEIIMHDLSVFHYGNSQKNRVRLVIIGYRKDLNKQIKNKIQYHFSNIYKVSSIKTCEELIEGLEEENYDLCNVREDINSIITLYAGFKISLKDIRDYWLRYPDLKRYLVRDRRFTTAPGVYRNLSSDYPATARKANRQFNHYGLQLTPRELARIQGVPDSFNIHFDINNKQYWINKGRVSVTKTPPYEIGLWFYTQLKKILIYGIN